LRFLIRNPRGRMASGKSFGNGKTTAAIERLEDRKLLSSTSITVNVPTNKTVEFAGPGTTVNSLLFVHSTGSVQFSGTNLAQTALKNGTPVISGTITSIQQINVTGSSGGASALVFRSGASKTPVEIDGISVTTALRQLQLAGTSLKGALTTEGTSSATFGTIGSSTLQFNASPTGSPASGPLTFVSGDITDTQITSALPIRQMITGNYTATTPTTSTALGTTSLNAPSISSWRVNGMMSGDVTLTGGTGTTLNSLTATGAVSAGIWNITGNVGRVSVQSIAAGVQAQFTTSVQNIKTAGDEDGSLFAGSVGIFTVGGQMSGGGLELSSAFSARAYSLNQLNVTGGILNAYVLAIGNINAISASTMSGSFIFSGISTSFGFTAQPQVSDFGWQTRLNSITLRSKAAQFGGSLVAGYTVGRLSLGAVQANDSGTQFGVTAHSISNVRFTVSVAGATKPASLTNVTAATLAAQLKKAGLTTADLQDFTFNL
jgi:hypothetical protein